MVASKPLSVSKAWMGLILLLLTVGIGFQTDIGKNGIVGDESTHLSIALSIWNDADLEYTKRDIEYFADLIPGEEGPRSAFLKYGTDDKIYYAKPIIFGVLSAPFVGLLGIQGIYVLNLMILAGIGIVAIRALEPHLGAVRTLVVTTGLLLLSPFIAWTPIAHPDLLIAGLLATGGYLIAGPEGNFARKLVGALILGLAIYEKITFGPIAVAILITQIGREGSGKIFILLAVMFGAWLLPSSVHYFQDGNFSAYKGLRFLARGPEGAFPLQSRWQGLPADFQPSDPFGIRSVAEAVIGNLGLLPQKLADAAVGRQTGLVLYFPLLLIMVCWLATRFTWRAALVMAAFFGYLMLNWLAFPTNGYGGAGTYGPRYTMQAMPVVFIGFLYAKSKSLYEPLNAIGLGIGVAIALVAHHHLYPPAPFSRSDLRDYLMSPIARYFPLETTLIPTISGHFPERVIAKRDYNYLYQMCGPVKGKTVMLDEISANCQMKLFQFKQPRSVPPMLISTTRGGRIRMRQGQKYVEKKFDAGRTVLAGILPDFTRTYTDVIWGQFRYAQLEVRPPQEMQAGQGLPAVLTMDFLGDASDKEKAQIKHVPTGKRIPASSLKEYGIELDFAWSKMEKWGIWTNGEVATLSIPIESWKGRKATEVRLRTVGYVPPETEPLEVDVYLNQKFMKSWVFSRNSRVKMGSVSLPYQKPEIVKDLVIGFHVKNPRSPSQAGRGRDTRELGLGLTHLEIRELTGTSKIQGGSGH